MWWLATVMSLMIERAAFRSKIASLGAQRALATSRLKRHPAFNRWAKAMTG